MGKFNTQEDLAKAYTELEKRVGQQPKNETPEPPVEQTDDNYTAEAASELYGKEYVDALSEKGVDMADIMKRADSGEDISANFDTLAEVFNVPKAVVENYVNADFFQFNKIRTILKKPKLERKLDWEIDLRYKIKCKDNFFFKSIF